MCNVIVRVVLYNGHVRQPEMDGMLVRHATMNGA